MASVHHPLNPTPHVVVQGQAGAPLIQVAAQQPATIVVQNRKTSEAYNAKSARITGWIQINCAIACIVFGVVELLVGSTVSIVGTGIWSGLLFFLPTGILGIVSQKKNTCVIVAYMVMSTISSLFAFIVFAMGITSALISTGDLCNYVDTLPCRHDLKPVRITFDSLLAITGLLELVVSIVAACYCGGGVFCGRNNSSTNTMNNVTPVVMMVPSYGQPVGGRPMGYVGQQPPPAYQPQGHYPSQVAYSQVATGQQPNYKMEATAPPQYSEMEPLNQPTQPKHM